MPRRAGEASSASSVRGAVQDDEGPGRKRSTTRPDVAHERGPVSSPSGCRRIQARLRPRLRQTDRQQKAAPKQSR